MPCVITTSSILPHVSLLWQNLDAASPILIAATTPFAQDKVI